MSSRSGRPSAPLIAAPETEAGLDSRRPPRRPAEWRWRTFPVFAAFTAGLLLAFIVNEGSVNPIAFVLQIAALLGVGYSIAHVVLRRIVIARRISATDFTPDKEADTEDVVVFPGEDGVAIPH